MPAQTIKPPEWIEGAPVSLHSSIEIDAPPEVVWRRIADHTSWTEWFDALDKVEVTGDPSGVGGKRRVTIKRLSLDEQFTAWVDNEQFAFAIVRSPLVFVESIAEDVRLEPAGSGCRVVYRQGIAGKRGFGWLAKVAFKGLEADTLVALQRLKTLVEA